MNPQKTKSGSRWLLWAVPVALLAALALWWWLGSRPAARYAAAVTDAVTAETQELEPLVTLTQDEALTTWDEQGRVLLLSWNSSPEQYPAGDDIVLTQGELWTFTDREMAAWYAENQSGVTDWTLRLEQLIGLPPDAGYTHVSGFWTAPSDVVRPAYVPDPTAQMDTQFPAGTDPDFQAWFTANSAFSYEESAYPWTRLGYTYDWADNGTEYGLTEFLIARDATVTVAFTKTTEEFLTWLDQGTP